AAVLVGCACPPPPPGPPDSHDSRAASPSGRVAQSGQDGGAGEENRAVKDSRPEPRLSARVGGVKLSPDSKLALVPFVYNGHGSRSPDREPLKLFDVDTGQDLRGFKGLSLDALDFLPSGTQVLGRAADGTLTVWDVRSGRELRRFAKGRSPIERLAVSPDGRY